MISESLVDDDLVQRWPLSLFDNTRAVDPVARVLTFGELRGLVAPEVPPEHFELGRRCAARQQELDGIVERVLAGEDDEDLRRGRWGQALLRAAEAVKGTQAAARQAAVEGCAARLRKRILGAPKGVLPCWSPVTYAEGATRGNEGVRELHALVLDYDNGASIEEACEAWQGWPFFLASTLSHHDDAHRFRVVLPLDVPVPAHAWPRVMAWAQSHHPVMDKACSDPARVFLLPAQLDPAQPYVALEHDPGGHLLAVDWKGLPDPRPASKPHRALRRPVMRVPEDHRRAKARQLLLEDAETRARAADFLGAQVKGNTARGVRCPGCGEPAVWFFIDPSRLRRAKCNHERSCSWTGHLDELLDAAGDVDVVAS